MYFNCGYFPLSRNIPVCFHMNDAAFSWKTWCLIYVCKWRSNSPVFARGSRSICTSVDSWDKLLKLQGGHVPEAEVHGFVCPVSFLFACLGNLHQIERTKTLSLPTDGMHTSAKHRLHLLSSARLIKASGVCCCRSQARAEGAANAANMPRKVA